MSVPWKTKTEAKGKRTIPDSKKLKGCNNETQGKKLD